MRRSCRPLERVGRNRSQLRDEISRRFSGLKANNVLEFLFIASFSYVRDRTRECGFTREIRLQKFQRTIVFHRLVRSARSFIIQRSHETSEIAIIFNLILNLN